jgi:hypothetical protein
LVSHSILDQFHIQYTFPIALLRSLIVERIWEANEMEETGAGAHFFFDWRRYADVEHSPFLNASTNVFPWV